MALKLVKSASILAGIVAIGTVSLSIFMEGASSNIKEILNLPATGIETMGTLFLPLIFVMFFMYWISNR